MKITMFTVGSTGDVRPLVLLGRELQQRGHVVTIATFDTFRSLIEENGMSFKPLAGDAQELMADIMRPGVQGVGFLAMVVKNLGKIAPTFLQGLLKAGEDADAIVCNFFGSLYYSVAEYYNIPVVQCHLYPMDRNDLCPIAAAPGQHLGKHWYHFTYRIGYLLISALEKIYLRRWRRAHDLDVRHLVTAPDYRVRDHQIRAMYAISPQVFPPDPSWGERIQTLGFFWDRQAAPAAPSAELEAFLAQGETPVYVGFGSMVSGNMQKTLDTVVAGIRESGLRAVVSVGWSDVRHPASDAQIFFAHYVQHEWLFPRVKAVVHHGGAGTFSAGLRYGKPTLVIPFGGDQPFWAARAEALHVGPKSIKRTRVTAKRFAKALQELVSNPEYEANAKALGAQMAAEDGVKNAADFVEKAFAEW